jgi:hypothetical protein
MTRRMTPIQEPANMLFEVMCHELAMKPSPKSAGYHIGLEEVQSTRINCVPIPEHLEPKVSKSFIEV